MSVKTDSYYRKIILEAKKFNDPEDIADYFFSEYKQCKDDNPRFKIKLKETIGKVINEVDVFRNELIDKDKRNKYLNPDGSKIQKSNYNQLNFPIELKEQKFSFTPELTKAFQNIIPGNYNSKISKNQLLIIEKALPYLILKIGDSETTPEDDITVEFHSAAQKIAWLYELGVIDTIINQCREGEIIVLRRASNIINSFTDINKDTLRKCLEAIYLPNPSNKKNNPLKNTTTTIYISDLREKFKLKKKK